MHEWGTGNWQLAIGVQHGALAFNSINRGQVGRLNSNWQWQLAISIWHGNRPSIPLLGDKMATYTCNQVQGTQWLPTLVTRYSDIRDKMAAIYLPPVVKTFCSLVMEWLDIYSPEFNRKGV